MKNKEKKGTAPNHFLHEGISGEGTHVLDLRKIGTAFSLRSNGILQSPLRTVHRRTSIIVMLIQTITECHTLCLLITKRLALIF